MSHDFEFEPLPGLPAPLPANEELLWQGRPQWQRMALHSYHVRKVALYFGALALWSLTHGLLSNQAGHQIGISCGLLLTAGSCAVAVLTLLAYLSGRSAIYTITSHRVLIRHGIAVPMTLNIPFSRVEGASLRMFDDGSGNIALRVSPGDRVGYLITWPHVRPRCFKHPQPSLLAIANAQEVAARLVSAISPETRFTPRSEAKPQPAVRPSSASPVLPGAMA